MLRLKALFGIVLLVAAIALRPAAGNAAPKMNLKFASWQCAAENSIVKRWVDKYDIKIDAAAG